MRVFLIAGEPSGDKLGGALMAGLKTLQPDVTFDGVGGAMMQAQGLASRFPMDELTVMGIAEVLPRYRSLKARISQCAEWVKSDPPDVLITIDSPDLGLRVCRKVKAANPAQRTVHYVAPSVWAWRPGRADKMAKVVDHVLCLLPFEPPLMTRAGMQADFVGHPVVAEPQATENEVAAFRDRFDLNGVSPVILALPGSRRGEVDRLGPVFGQALRLVTDGHPNTRVVVPTTEGVADRVKDMLATWPCDPILIGPGGKTSEQYMAEKRAAFAMADVALAASGTVSLELAAAKTPMVIAYDMNWFSRFVISRMLRVDTGASSP